MAEGNSFAVHLVFLGPFDLCFILVLQLNLNGNDLIAAQKQHIYSFPSKQLE